MIFDVLVLVVILVFSLFALSLLLSFFCLFSVLLFILLSSIVEVTVALSEISAVLELFSSGNKTLMSFTFKAKYGCSLFSSFKYNIKSLSKIIFLFLSTHALVEESITASLFTLPPTLFNSKSIVCIACFI